MAGLASLLTRIIMFERIFYSFILLFFYSFILLFFACLDDVCLHTVRLEGITPHLRRTLSTAEKMQTPVDPKRHAHTTYTFPSTELPCPTPLHWR